MANLIDVEMPDGTIIEGVPEGTTKAELQAKLERFNTPKQQDGNPVLETIKNIPRSGAQFVGNIAQAVMSPVETVKGIGTLASGLVDLGARKLEAAAPQSVRDYFSSIGQSAYKQEGWESPRQAVSAVGGFYKDRYGSFANTGRTIVNDPVGVMADASAVLGLGAGVLRTAGLRSASDAAMRASSAINPINVAIKTAQKTIVPATKAIYTSALGGTTGSGKFAIEKAIEGKPEFVQAMRGGTTDEGMVTAAKDAVGKLKEARSTAYQEQLSTIKNATQNIDISGVKNTVEGYLKRFGVQKKPEGLDFSRSTLADKAAQDVVTSLYDDISNWGSKPGDLTPISLDTLKRRVGSLYTPNGDARAMVAGIRDTLHRTISNSVPEYSKLTGDYAKATKTINEVEKALSLGDRSSIDTAATKLITAIRKDNEFRRSLMGVLDEQSGQSVVPMAAGRALSNVWSNRLGSYATQAAAGGAALAMNNPMLASIMALASPRIAGELSLLLGRISSVSGKTIRAAAPAAVPLEQSGKLTTVE